MPCYLRGTIRITDFERLQQQAYSLGLIITKNGTKIKISRGGVLIAETTEKELIRGGNQYFKEVMKQYTICQVRLSAQKKGWKVKSIKEDSQGKVKIRLGR